MKNIETLHRIAQYLMINSASLNNLGLFHGKMGVALFFAHYAKYTETSRYYDLLEDLLGDIYEDINTSITIDFESGLSGIGWGIEYLVQNQFLTGDTGEILEDIDYLIMERNPLRIKNPSFKRGLKGVCFYVLSHMKSPSAKATIIDNTYLTDLFTAISKSDIDFLQLMSIKKIPDILFGNLPDIRNEDISSFPVGIENGISGVGLKLMEK